MIDNKPLYPLLFEPILKEKVWGGHKLITNYHKKAEGTIGESWEISSVENNISVVANGNLKGTPLTNLLQAYTSNFLGEKVYSQYGLSFPLLFKFIDAKEDLSVQLHPDDTLAKKRHNSYGKTEMWYIMQAEKNSRLILGFKEGVDQNTYIKHLKENSLPTILKSKPVKEGDAFFIAPGTVHAIGAGTVLAEIQQTSDITYRIYDWDRPDTDGKLRALHTEEALAAINYQQQDPELSYHQKKNEAILLKRSDFFETNKFILTQQITRDLSQLDSFVVYMCVEGEATLQVANFSETIITGQTILIPACFKTLEIKTKKAVLLEVYIP